MHASGEGSHGAAGEGSPVDDVGQLKPAADAAPAADPNAAQPNAAQPKPVAPMADAASSGPPAPRPGTGGEVRRLDRAPGERYRTAEAPPKPAPARRRRLGAALAAALGTAVVTFALVTFDIGPGLLVVGIAGGWVTGLAITGGARAGRGDDAGPGRAAAAGILAAAGLALGLVLDALRAYALGGVLLPWEYALARFGWVAPAAVVLAAIAGAVRGR